MSVSTPPTIRDAVPADAESLLAVIEAAYPSWPSFPIEIPAIDHLRWKMSPPMDIPLHHAVVEVDGRVAATQLRWVGYWQVGDEVRIAETGADLAVHPDFQGLGLSRLIKGRDHVRLTAERIAGVAMRSNAPQVRHMNQDMATRRMTTWTRPFSLRSYLATHATRGPRALARAAWRRIRRRRTELPPSFRIEVIDHFDERADALWNAARHTYDVIPVRDATYLNWRFERPHAGEPVILGVFADARMVAYAVARRADDRGDLMDRLWRPEAEPALPALIEAVGDYLAEAGAPAVTCWLPEDHPAAQRLHDAGFAATGTQFMQFGSRTAADADLELLDRYEDPGTSLHFSMSDFDYV